mgnify:CR=1 FL=1
MKKILIILFLLPLTFFGQSITAPPGRTYQVNTSGQDASGFAVNGFTTETLLTSIGFVNPPAGVTFSITTTTGLSFATGYSSWSNITRVSFTGTQSNINNALATLKVNTSSTTGNVQISVSATVNPTNYYYLPTNGHFYKYVSWPTGVSGGDAAYLNIKSAAQSTIFKGQTGYLVTITSSDEQNFIQTNVVGSNILIALTDRTQEGVWKWDAGPELGTTIKTANSGGEVSGQYNNWCSGEPNNWGSGENYVVTKWGGGNCWNDYGPAATAFPGGIGGFVIEFGTWTNPDDQTFANFYSNSVSHSNGQTLRAQFNFTFGSGVDKSKFKPRVETSSDNTTFTSNNSYVALNGVGRVDLTSQLDATQFANGYKATIAPGQVEWSLINPYESNLGGHRLQIDERVFGGTGINLNDIKSIKLFVSYLPLKKRIHSIK